MPGERALWTRGRNGGGLRCHRVTPKFWKHLLARTRWVGGRWVQPGSEGPPTLLRVGVLLVSGIGERRRAFWRLTFLAFLPPTGAISVVLRPVLGTVAGRSEASFPLAKLVQPSGSSRPLYTCYSAQGGFPHPWRGPTRASALEHAHQAFILATGKLPGGGDVKIVLSDMWKHRKVK